MHHSNYVEHLLLCLQINVLCYYNNFNYTKLTFCYIHLLVISSSVFVLLYTANVPHVKFTLKEL